jgi:hypothetical protein
VVEAYGGGLDFRQATIGGLAVQVSLPATAAR